MKNRVNWTQAFAEVALLVVGIGLALAADAWNDHRLDRVAEAEYLESLRGDFEATKEQFIEAIGNNTEYLNSNLALLDLLSRSPNTVPADSIRKHGITAFYISSFKPVLGTYYDMVNSGRLELLRSDSLRSALAQFESSLGWLEDTYREGFDQWNQLQVPFMVEHLNVRRFVDESMFEDVEGLELPPSRFGEMPDAYWSLEFANILNVTAISRQSIVRTGNQRLERIEEILRLIEKARKGD